MLQLQLQEVVLQLQLPLVRHWLPPSMHQLLLQGVVPGPHLNG